MSNILRATTLAALTSALLLLPTAARAERYVLTEGRVVVGVEVHSTADTVSVETEEGEVTLARAEIVMFEPDYPASPAVVRRAERAREKLLKAAWAEAKKLIRTYDDVTPEERAAVEAALLAMPSAVRREALAKGLKDGPAVTRALAIRLLGGSEDPEALQPLLRHALTGNDAEAREQAHQAAMHLDGTRTRELYEKVARAQVSPDVRVAAIQRVQAIGDPGSIPQLIQVLENVLLDVRAELGRLKELRRVPVQLGTIGQTGINVPIELPEMELTAVATRVTVPSLRMIGGAASTALGKLSGQSFGEDVGAWRSWWEEHGARLERMHSTRDE